MAFPMDEVELENMRVACFRAAWPRAAWWRAVWSSVPGKINLKDLAPPPTDGELVLSGEPPSFKTISRTQAS